MPVFALFDVGSTYTKGLIVSTDLGKILALGSAFTTAQTDISEGIDKVRSLMRDQVGDLIIDQTRVCSSAKGGLKMIAIGLVPDLTLKAATLACYSAGAKVIGTYAFELNQSELLEIQNAQCDILLLSGGTDGGNTDVVLHNAKMIASLHPSFPVIYAGNKTCQDTIKAIFEPGGWDLQLCDNVMPDYGQLQVEACRELIRQLFLKTIVKAKGLSQLSSLIGDIVLPTPMSVMAALSLLSKGTAKEPGWGDLMAIDIGGATTDVYSMNSKFVLHPNAGYKGLQEPLEKRSVEGDLGVRFSAAHVAGHMKDDPQMDEAMKVYLEDLQRDPHRLADLEKDTILAKWCTSLATARHAGRLESAYTPMGVLYYQIGKDLSAVQTIIGIGGPLIHSAHPKEILKHACVQADHPEILLPQHLLAYLDRSYVISCLGLLAQTYPDLVLRLLKHHLEKLS